MYICQNGEFFKEEEKTLTNKNRAFTYGDALFETIHCLGTLPQFIDLHWSRLLQGMNLLKMIPGEGISKEILVKHIEKLLNKNRIFKGARIRLEVYRNEGGLYAPSDDNVSWTMETSALEHEQFGLNKKGLTADIFGEVLKPVNPLSNLKTANALIYVLAGIFRRENALDDSFILNQYGRIAETGHSNIFILLDEKLITPPLSEGCIAGTMRHTIIDLAREAGYAVEERGLLETSLLDAEEIFITNAIQGIQWIGAYKDRRYFNFAARKLISLLNQRAFR